MKTKKLIIATWDYGWNAKENRPATREESYSSNDVCMCTYCADDSWYGPHYCKRHGESNERFYSDHSSRWR